MTLKKTLSLLKILFIYSIMFWLVFQVLLGSSYYDKGFELGYKEGQKSGYIKAAIHLLNKKLIDIDKKDFSNYQKVTYLKRWKFNRLVRKNNRLILRQLKKVKGVK